MVAVFEVPLKVAVMVATVFEATLLVLTVAVAVLLPLVTMTEAGTVAALVVSLLSETEIPLLGAAESSVTVAVAEAPPSTELGAMPSELSTGGVTVRAALALLLFALAVMFAVWFVATAEVETVNVAVELPAVTVTEAGTVAAAVLSLESETVVSDAGALESVTVPLDVLPPSTDVGERPTLWTVTATGLIVKVAVAVVP